MGTAMPENAHLKSLTIHLDEERKEVIATFAPQGGVDAIVSDDLMRAIDAAGLGGYSIHQQPPLADATAKYNSGTAFEIIVGEALDGEFAIRIDADLMAAYLSCTLPHGGAPVQKQAILHDAEKKGITVALDHKAIDKALHEGGDNILIACGRPPVAGVDGRVESLIPSMKEKSPRLDEHGLADFRELGEIVIVHAKDALMRRILATKGDPGETVTGKGFTVKPGKNIAFSAKLTGVTFDPNNPNLLIADITGCPVVVKNGVSVEPVYTATNVDLRTGNISFSGSVHVTGDVHAGMVIKATGDIHVDGTVENSTLEAGSDIVVKGGVIGDSNPRVNADKKSFAAIKCNGSFTARFVQNANISAGNGIFIKDIAMLSELTAGHQIIVGDKASRRGDIIGGVVRATMLVKAHNIGSLAYLKTVVIAGADQQLQERLSINTQNRSASERKLADIIKLLDLARTSPGQMPPETVVALGSTRDALNAEIEMLREDEIELCKEIDLASGAQVVVGKHVFVGTEIRIGSKRINVTKDIEGGIFRLSDGDLIFV
jgi:uncharacterized protein (DUF342 family)